MTDKPIESNLRVDPAIMSEIQHRWDCFEVMLEALKEVDGCYTFESVKEAIKVAESREPMG